MQANLTLKIQLLESLPGWEWREDKFERSLNAKAMGQGAREIPKVNGSDVVVNGETFKLGTWVSLQRQAYRSGRFRTTA